MAGRHPSQKTHADPFFPQPPIITAFYFIFIFLFFSPIDL
jgi:hypothetical protein